nr:Rho GDP-dissociation inhibitor 1-like [Tanacetum cinerariifolium]
MQKLIQNEKLVTSTDFKIDITLNEGFCFHESTWNPCPLRGDIDCIDDKEAPPSGSTVHDDSDTSSYATEDEEDTQIHLGPKISIKEHHEKDKDDESLRKWKEQLLGSVDVSQVEEVQEPDVKILNLTIVSAGRPDIVLEIPDFGNSTGLWFTLKEGDIDRTDDKEAPPSGSTVHDDSDTSSYATEDEEDTQIHLGPKISIKKHHEKDKDDESLRKWKEQLLGSVDVSQVEEVQEPDVKILNLTIVSAGRPDIVLEILDFGNSKGLWFTLKEVLPLYVNVVRIPFKTAKLPLVLLNVVKAWLESEKDIRLGDSKAAEIEILNVFQLLNANSVVYLCGDGLLSTTKTRGRNLVCGGNKSSK